MTGEKESVKEEELKLHLRREPGLLPGHGQEVLGALWSSSSSAPHVRASSVTVLVVLASTKRQCDQSRSPFVSVAKCTWVWM